MPRFFFNVLDSRSLPDIDGVELPDISRIRAEAIRLAADMLHDMDGKFAGEDWILEVTDEGGQPVVTLRFSAIEHRT